MSNDNGAVVRRLRRQQNPLASAESVCRLRQCVFLFFAFFWTASARPSGLNSQLSCDDLFAKPLSHSGEMMLREIDSSRRRCTLNVGALYCSLLPYARPGDADGDGDAFSGHC